MVDEDLNAIRAICDGEESALIELMDRYRQPIFRLAFRYVSNVTDAQWLTEETFSKVYFHAPKFRPKASVKSWIFAIAANHCRDFLRQRKKHRYDQSLSDPTGALEQKLGAEGRSDEIRDAIDSDEQMLQIQAAIRALPEKLRFPFIFCVLEEHSQEEAAAVLKTTRKTVETRVYRARHELQEHLRNQELA